MIDLDNLRNNLKEVSSNLMKRGFKLDEVLWASLEENRKHYQVKMESLQADQNKIAKEIAQLQQDGKESNEEKSKATKISKELKKVKEKFQENKVEYDNFLLSLPNILSDSVPSGIDENDNEIIFERGKIPSFDFSPKDHQELGLLSDGMDFEAASKISKSRFVVFKDSLALLNRALINFMLDIHTKEHLYKEIYVPLIVNSESLTGTGQLPKFKEDQFKIDDSEQDLYLIPTAEVPVTNYHRNEILELEDLPLSYVCHTPCFRSEAGSYGLDTKGIIRQHQFEKVELVSFVEPDKSDEQLEILTSHAENILKKLNLPFRKVIL